MEFDQLEKQNALLRQYVSGLETENESRYRENEILKQQVDELTRQIQFLQENKGETPYSSSFLKEIFELKLQVKRLQQEKLVLLDACKEMDHLSNLLEQREEQISTKEERINQLLYDFEQMRQQLSANTPNGRQSSPADVRMMERVQKENKLLHTHNQELEEEKRQLTSRYQKQLNKMKTELAELEKQLGSGKQSALRNECSTLKTHSRKSIDQGIHNEDSVRIRCQYRELSLQMESITNQNKFLTEFKESQKLQIQKLKLQVSDAKKANTDQVTQLKTKLSELRGEMFRKERQHQSKLFQQIENVKRSQLQIKRAQQTQQIRRFTNEIADLKEQRGKLEKEKLKLQSNLRELEESSKNQLDEQANKLKKHAKQKQQIEKNLLSKERQIKILKSQLNDLEAQLQEKNGLLEKRAEGLEQLERGLLELDEERNQQNYRYVQIIEVKNHQVETLRQAYTKKMTAMNEELQMAKYLIEDLKQVTSTQDQLDSLKLQMAELEEEGRRQRNDIREREKLIRSLQSENKELKNSINGYSIVTRGRESDRSHINSPANRRTATKTIGNCHDTFNPSQTDDSCADSMRKLLINLRTELDYVKQSNLGAEKQNVQLHNILINKPRAKQQHYQVSCNSPKNQRALKENTIINNLANKSYSSKNEVDSNISKYGRPTVMVQSEDPSYRKMPCSKPASENRVVNLSKELCSETGYFRNTAQTKPANKNYFKKICEPTQTTFGSEGMSKACEDSSSNNTGQSRWNNLQEKIDNLRRENKQLKKVLFN